MVTVPLSAEWWGIGLGTGILACLIRSDREPSADRLEATPLADALDPEVS